MTNHYFLSFKKKAIVCQIVLFFACALAFFFLLNGIVNYTTNRSIEKSADEFIEKINSSTDIHSMIDALSVEESFVFFQLSLFDHQGIRIYDSHLNSLELNGDSQPEVLRALKYGYSRDERYSNIFRQSIHYGAKSFTSHGHEYVLRIGLPFSEIRALQWDFEIGCIILGTFVLTLYGAMIWLIIHRVSKPVQQIINAMKPYQDGKEEFIPRIAIEKQIPSQNEFNKLVQTFNSLNERIQRQIGHLMEQRQRMNDILESLGEGVIAVDVDGSITFANHAANQMLKADNLIGQKVKNVEAGRSQMIAKCQELIDLAVERSETVIESLTILEGQKLYFDLIALPEARGGMILVLQDKTSDYELIEMGKDFIANASHELRTPITIIRGFAECLHDRPKFTAIKTREITDKILKTSIRLDNLVKSLLTLADIENLRDEHFQIVDLASIAKDCQKLVQITHPSSRISLHPVSACVWGEVDLLSMAIMNLLENAVKYSPSPAQIEITMQIATNMVELNVKDLGIGIPQSDLPRIFDRFYTVDKARSRKSGGAGLGLSLVKTIVNKHKGEASATSQLGKGSTFTIRIPLHRT